MKIQSILKNTLFLFLAALLVTACDKHGSEAGHDDHTEEAEEAKGPNRGKLLKDDDFTIEVTIFETGRPPEYRLYAYENGQELDPKQVKATVTLDRLDGEKNVFNFTAVNNYLMGDGVVTEPHSFDVTVEATYKGKTHRWKYDSYEGRTAISDKMAKEVGIATEIAGPQEIEQYIDVIGELEFAPNAKSTVKARYPGKILKVYKFEGDEVKKGDLLAKIESDETLQSYTMRASIDGVMVNSYANEGDVVDRETLFVIGDLTKLRVDFHVYPGDQTTIRPGQKTRVSTVDHKLQQDIILDHYLPELDLGTQTKIIHAMFPNLDKKWFPGMKVIGRVVTEKIQVPLAVKNDALQGFRDFTVVFAKIGEQYEVRMLELGRKSDEYTEVLSGLKIGQEYVTENSFVIKADIEKSGASHDH